MTPSPAASWLPPGTLPTSGVEELLAKVVEAWSTRWFTGPPMGLSPIERGPSSRTWRLLDGVPLLSNDPDAAIVIGSRVLAVDRRSRPAHDRALLEEVAEDCLADLRDRLAAMVEVTPDQAWRPTSIPPTWSATIDGLDGLLAVGLPDALFAVLLRRAMPPSSSVPLGSGIEALACLEVSVSAAVGRADLTVADLQALEIGDVVVLDHALVDPVPLAIDGRALARGMVRVVAASPRPRLEIVTAA